MLPSKCISISYILIIEINANRLLVDEGEAVGAKDVENDAGVPRVALPGSWLLDEAGDNYRPIAALIEVD